MNGARFFFITAVIVLLVLTANGLYVILNFSGNLFDYMPEPISGIGSDDGDHDSFGYWTDNMSADPEGIKIWQSDQNDSGSIGNRPVNLLLLGLDMDKTRCDVIMLLSFDPEASTLKILSIARDTRIISAGSYKKINSFYSRGGAKRVAKEVSRITGLPVHYYVTADFKGFRKIIDTLGGVEFDVPFKMNYDDPTQNLHIHLKKGIQLLDGKKAEQLVRYRKGNHKGQGYVEGDIGRIRMQQDFMKALIEQKLDIKYISKADDIFEILKDHVKTNITLSDIARYAGCAAKLRSGSIESYVLPGESQMIGNVWWYIYDREKTYSMINENFR